MVRPGLALAGVVLIGVGAAIAFGWWDEDTAEASGRVSDPIRSVQIANDNGDVTIRAGDVESTRVRQQFSYRWGEPEDSYQVDGDELVLNDCGWNCSVSYDVVVPRGTAITGSADSGNVTLTDVGDVDVRASSGEVEVRRAAGTVNVDANSGGVELIDIAGPASVHANSGNIQGRDLRGDLDVRANSGDITLGMSRASNVTAEANSGNIDLTVPDRRYQVQVEGNGDEAVDVRVDDRARYLLDLNASSGDVTVRTAHA
ncbi:MAG: DUF4097 family beta strand repeat protein [Pseudonocardiaceae bacterium]|nr:DUF4097 family beta strand repeat protein [Pseudonocardiaceae bacterium]